MSKTLLLVVLGTIVTMGHGWHHASSSSSVSGGSGGASSSSSVHVSSVGNPQDENGDGVISTEEWWWDADDIQAWFDQQSGSGQGSGSGSGSGGSSSSSSSSSGGGSGGTPPPPPEVCGLLANGSIDYTEHGANWCGACATRDNQSPVHVPNVFNQLFIRMSLDYGWSNVRRAYVDVSRNFVKLRFQSDGFARIRGAFLNGSDSNRTFFSTGVAEFHTPAEHILPGDVVPDVELEFLMEDDEGNMARISVFFDRVEGGNCSNSFIEGLQLDSPGRQNRPNVRANIRDLFENITADDFALYMYEGSLPYPPCDIDVLWFLFNNVQTISDEQLALLRSYFSGNNREVQDNDNGVMIVYEHDMINVNCGQCF